ncbi:hypothetical protein [Maribellus maritimus]|uniref:hypothetical protein n=1 Tax=Maribellus maritimus TaxID=2870838 RepID=UPI001EEAEFD9|nr:hypothetical protein [Maribellus maritimus]MCG6187471.1 hypothetical protein [Maribellus maritimus]
MKQKIYWRITAAIAVLLILLTFTPLVIAPGKTDPKLFSMPYTLWTSILITIALVVLTYIGGRVHLNDDNDD